MKQCKICNSPCEDNAEYCPTCGGKLPIFDSTDSTDSTDSADSTDMGKDFAGMDALFEAITAEVNKKNETVESSLSPADKDVPEIQEHREEPQTVEDLPKQEKKPVNINAIIIIAMIVLGICAILFVLRPLLVGHPDEPYLEYNYDRVEDNGGEDETDEDAAAYNEPAATEVIETAAPSITLGRVSWVTASSYLKEPQYNLEHKPENIVDGLVTTAWVEGVTGQGIGENITIYFDGTYTVSGFVINSGYQKSEAIYNNNSRPSSLMVTFSDGTSQIVALDDINGPQRIVLNAPVETDSIKLTIVSTYSDDLDTCISDIVFF